MKNTRHIRGAIQKWQLLQDRQPRKDARFHLAAAELQRQQDRFELLQKNRRYHPHLQKHNAHIDLFFILEKLRIACDMSSRNTVIQTTYRCSHLPEIKAWIKGHPAYLEHPGIKTCWLCLQVMEQQQERDYFALKEALRKNAGLFSSTDLRTLYQYALNYSIKKVNSGDDHFYQEIISSSQQAHLRLSQIGERQLHSPGPATILP